MAVIPTLEQGYLIKSKNWRAVLETNLSSEFFLFTWERCCITWIYIYFRDVTKASFSLTHPTTKACYKSNLYQNCMLFMNLSTLCVIRHPKSFATVFRKPQSPKGMKNSRTKFHNLITIIKKYLK